MAPPLLAQRQRRRRALPTKCWLLTDLDFPCAIPNSRRDSAGDRRRAELATGPPPYFPWRPSETGRVVGRRARRLAPRQPVQAVDQHSPAATDPRARRAAACHGERTA